MAAIMQGSRQPRNPAGARRQAMVLSYTFMVIILCRQPQQLTAHICLLG